MHPRHLRFSSTEFARPYTCQLKSISVKLITIIVFISTSQDADFIGNQLFFNELAVWRNLLESFMLAASFRRWARWWASDLNYEHRFSHWFGWIDRVGNMQALSRRRL